MYDAWSNNPDAINDEESVIIMAAYRALELLETDEIMRELIHGLIHIRGFDCQADGPVERQAAIDMFTDILAKTTFAINRIGVEDE
jgi:ssRNA-specific RNase YbeY (16S rRNA maturation enzyme)